MLNTKQNLQAFTEVTLPKFKIWSIEGNRRGDVINCLSGSLWVTQEGDLKDYVLEAGKSFWVTKPGSVVVQALDHSQFKYSLNELQEHIEPVRQPIHQQTRLTHPR